MPDMSILQVNGTDYNVKDSTARSSASAAASAASAAQTAAEAAQSTANTAIDRLNNISASYESGTETVVLDLDSES